MQHKQLKERLMMETLLVIPPGDAKWWLLRPEFFAFIDKIQIDPKDYAKTKSERKDSGYNKVIWDRLSVLIDKDKVSYFFDQILRVGSQRCFKISSESLI